MYVIDVMHIQNEKGFDRMIAKEASQKKAMVIYPVLLPSISHGGRQYA